MFFRKRHQLSLDDVACDTHQWSVQEKSTNNCLWFTPEGAAVLLRLNSGTPNFPFDLTDLEGAKYYFEQESAQNLGSIVSLTIDTLDNPEVLKGIVKYRSPEPSNSRGMYYVGILLFIYRSFSFQFNTEAFERGTTGIRECAVMMARPELFPPIPQVEEIPRIENLQDSEEEISQTPPPLLPSDDEEFDELLPNHPLSIVRALQSHILDTLSLSERVTTAEKYRL